MTSTGNDIVSLKQPGMERAAQPRFYQKILTATEQQLYQQNGLTALPLSTYVWLLWSVKESAYKYLKRANPALLFSPIKKVITQIGIHSDDQYLEPVVTCYSGKVQYGDQVLYFRSNITTEWISSVVNAGEQFKNVHCEVASIPVENDEHRSAAVRKLLLKKLSTFVTGDLHVKKSGSGYPLIMSEDTDLRIPASLAHHGNMVAYSFIL